MNTDLACALKDEVDDASQDVGRAVEMVQCSSGVAVGLGCRGSRFFDTEKRRISRFV